VLFCTIGVLHEPGVQKRTVSVRSCSIAGRDEETMHKCTPTSPTQRS
jgi:hypothetical protein